MAVILCSASVTSAITITVTNNGPSLRNVVKPTSHPDWTDASSWNSGTGRFDTAGTPIAWVVVGVVNSGVQDTYAIGGLYGDTGNSAGYTANGYGFTETLPTDNGGNPVDVTYEISEVDLEAMINASPDFATFIGNNDGKTITLVALHFCWFYDPGNAQTYGGV